MSLIAKAHQGGPSLWLSALLTWAGLATFALVMPPLTGLHARLPEPIQPLAQKISYDKAVADSLAGKAVIIDLRPTEIRKQKPVPGSAIHVPNKPDGQEWDKFTGLDLPANDLRAFIDRAPFNIERSRVRSAPRIAVPARLPLAVAEEMSTQEAFGRILFDLAAEDGELAERLVTTSPDVTVSTNLGGWVNRRGIFDRHRREDVFREEKVVSAQRWHMGQSGQHIELGIAENNLFLMLAALGLSSELYGVRLLPIGTLYDRL